MRLSFITPTNPATAQALKATSTPSIPSTDAVHNRLSRRHIDKRQTRQVYHARTLQHYNAASRAGAVPKGRNRIRRYRALISDLVKHN